MIAATGPSLGLLPPDIASPDAVDPAWQSCRFMTCSVLPVRMACNLKCPFCFSRSSVSSLSADSIDWKTYDLERYFAWSRERGATRLVVTGGGEPLLRPSTVVDLVAQGREFFSEIACFTNGTFLTPQLARDLQRAGLSYLCYSRHHADDQRCRDLMGHDAPLLADFMQSAGNLPVRATCVMAQEHVDSAEDVWDYIHTLATFGVRQFTFKHTYVAYDHSLFGDSSQNRWCSEHKLDLDPFARQGTVLATLPWGPAIRQIEGFQVCYYFEPSPLWEKEHQLCRSINLLSDGTIYASLEDQRSRLSL